MERIIVKIKGKKVDIKTEGFTGGACQAATANLSKALGKSVRDTPTSEMYETAATLDPALGQV